MFFCNNYDIIIIGGGISGLFMSYKLSHTGLSILLLESDDKLGGRVHTLKNKNVSYECGAARFHSSHTKLISLLHELNLEDKFINLPKDIKLILRNRRKNFPYQTNNKLDIKLLFKKSIEKRNEFSNDILLNITFFQYLVTIFDHETAEFIKNSFGYDSEFLTLNALSALDMFEHDFFKDDDYFILNGGLSQIIQTLENKLNNSPYVTIMKNTSVVHITDSSVVTNIQDTYYFNQLICAIPQKSLQKFHIFKDYQLLNSVSPIPLLRIYAKYPTKNLWFKNIKRTITDNYIRQIIPIDYKQGLIMISYTDGLYARFWNLYNANNEDFLIQALHKEIKDLYDIDPPKPEFISNHYWSEGVHMWKPGFDMNTSYERILKPFDDKKIFICGEAFCKKQGWMEGALESCYDVIKKLCIPNFTIQYDVVKDDVVKDDVVKDDVVKDNYTIDEVLNIKDKKLIIFDKDGIKKIYDITNWIPEHPGGSIILKGVEANKHYKDKKKYPKSPMDLFNEIHVHKTSDVFNNYIKNENSLVKYFGVLKD